MTSLMYAEKESLLTPYINIIKRRTLKVSEMEKKLTQGKTSLLDFASGHEYFGLNFRENQWVFREWAPNAKKIYIIGEKTSWQVREEFALKQINEMGIWEISIDPQAFSHGDLFRLKIFWDQGCGDRIPSYARRVVQDPNTLIFNAQVWNPPIAYNWKIPKFTVSDSPIIYETHIGMAQNEEKIGSFWEFKEKILPRIIRSGYNTIQIMAIQEHPYYGSFGYQVSNFFAASSRFGTPDELKELIDTAHASGIAVVMDIIHSHSVANEVEGLSRFDGTLYQYFHNGSRGFHPAWGSRCFDYGRIQVIHFLLSNCRFWLDEYHFDGFRFDGITSMLYHNHGLQKAFISYDDYYDDSVDEDALVYLALANKLIHEIKPDAVSIAEDVSGMPGLAVPINEGGIGFDYRFAMGVPDYWIKLIKEVPDDHWNIGHLWYELTNKRKDEKTISYAESHDQALVGDQTIIFRLIGEDMYSQMTIGLDNLKVDRGIALHKIIRLITVATAGNGYLNFMGNEFGHPEWIDFPREGNNWSFNHARRLWHLADNPFLKYKFLARFDQEMIELVKKYRLFESSIPYLLYEHIENKILIFKRSELIFVFNFNPLNSYISYPFEVEPGTYQMIFNSDDSEYGGHGRLLSNQRHFTIYENFGEEQKNLLSLYIPSRTAIVLKKEL